MEQEIKRLVDLLHQTNPLSKDYSLYLEQIRELYSIYYCYTQNDKPITTTVVTAKSEEQPKAVEEKVVEPTPLAKPVSKTVVEKQAPVVKEEVKDIPATDDTSTYTKEQVRALLSETSKNGIQIQPIIAKFVPEGKAVKFSEVPTSAYAELVKEIKNAR